MLRRLFFTVATSAAALSAVATGGAGTAVATGHMPAPWAGPAAGHVDAVLASVSPFTRLAPLPLPLPQTRDELTVTVTNPVKSASPATYELKCGPTGGTHPKAQAACDRLTELATGSRDPFAQVSAHSACTMQYGGPATAHVTGTWQGSAVDASFNRKNGCEIARWNNLEPVLPSLAS